MSVEDGERYNATIIECCRGDRDPNRSEPAQWILYDSFNKFRLVDRNLADNLSEHTTTLLIAQTKAGRSQRMNLEEYFEYRYDDLSKA